MALVAFLRGVNVGGHRTFRPSLLTKRLQKFGVVNIGAAGTFVALTPGSRAKFVAALKRELPFETSIAICDGAAIMRLLRTPPGGRRVAPDVVRFVSVLPRAPRNKPRLPVEIRADNEWIVRVIAVRGQFVLGVYRRRMKTIGALSKVDALFDAALTTRNWSTIEAIARVLSSRSSRPSARQRETA